MLPQAGVTLLELMVVVVIMAIIAALTMPAVLSISTVHNNEKVANDVASFLILTRQHAIAHSVNTKSFFGSGDPTNRTFVFGSNGYYFAEETVSGNPVTQPVSVTAATNGVWLDGTFSPAEIEFRPTGGLAGVALVQEILVKSATGVSTIQVKALTGLVRVL